MSEGDDDQGVLGEWPSIKIEEFRHSVIRHAYENALTAAARLAAFAYCKPTLGNGGLLNERQEQLAADDLISFALSARRLIENTSGKDRFNGVEIQCVVGGKQRHLPIWSVIGIIVHHRKIEITRTVLDFMLKAGQFNWQRDLHMLQESPYKDHFPPAVYVKSDRPDAVLFRLGDMVAAFEDKILQPIVDVCAEHQLFLEDLP